MREERGVRTNGPRQAVAPTTRGMNPAARPPPAHRSGLPVRPVGPQQAAALLRLRTRVEQLQRHRHGTGPATMPLPRLGRRRDGHDRPTGTTEVAEKNESGLDPDPAMAASVDADVDTPVHVTLLGNVEVRFLGPLTPQQQALVCFLALHPGAGREAVVEALWNGRAISESRFLNLIAETRAVVGSSRLPPANNGRYSVIGLVVDADLLTEAARQADHARRSGDRDEERRWLRRGLSLISGPLLRAPGRRYWTWLDDAYDVIAGLESIIVAQATRLVELALASGDTRSQDVETAAWAYRRCLLAVPHHDVSAQALAMLYRAMGRHSAARLLDRRRREPD